MPFYKSADTLSRFRGHPFTIPRTPFHDSADTHSRFRGHPCTISRTPLLDSADTRTRFRGYPRRCRGKTADFRRGQSADFVKFLVTSTVCTYVRMYVCTYIFTMCIRHLTLHTYVCIVRSLNLRSDTEHIGMFSLLILCVLSMQPSRFHPFCPLCAGYTKPLTPHITSLLIRGH